MNTETCKTCVGKDCNTMTDFRSCYVTDGNGPQSEWVKKTKVCAKIDDKCFSLITETGTIMKNCLSDYTTMMYLPIDHFAKNHNASVYRECSSSLCNDENIQLSSCFDCDTRYNQSCDGSEYINRLRCPLELKPSGCYHFTNGKDISRGCVAYLDNKQRQICESDSDECKKCSDWDCNYKKTFQKCLTANPKNVSDVQSKVCKRYSDSCFTYASGETIRRGCISDITESTNDGIGIDINDCDNDAKFEACNEDDCNDKEIERESCLVCSSETNKSCSQFPQAQGFETQCSLAVKKQGCFLRIDENSNVERGCVSHLIPRRINYCRAGSGTCKTCMGDNCNKKVNFQRCYHCDSQIDKQCFGPTWVLRDKVCPRYFDHCYTQVLDGQVRRGCIGDKVMPTIKKCEKNNDICKHCDDLRGCNGQRTEKEICIACDSTIDPSCATNMTFNVFEECPISINRVKCYHMINATTGEHKRGESFGSKFKA